MKRISFFLVFFTAMVFSTSSFAHAAEVVETTDVSLETFAKDVSLSTTNKGFSLRLPAKTMREASRIDLKTIDQADMAATFPSTLKPLSDVYLFDIVQKKLFRPTDTVELTVFLPPDEGILHGRRRLYFFNGTKKTWEPIPSEDEPRTGTIKARMHLPFSRVMVFEEAVPEIGTASWYGYKACNCAASPDYPKGTKLKVTSVADPKKSVIVTVNDYGPDRAVHPERVIDLDKVAFKKLAPLGAGVIRVRVEPL